MDQTGNGYSDSTASHRRLEALLAQWQHLDGFINITEARYNTILMVLVTLLAAGNFYVASNEAPLESRGIRIVRIHTGRLHGPFLSGA